MIREINKQLEELQEKLSRKNRVEKLLEGLYVQRETQKVNVEILESVKLKEEKDVRKIEGISLEAIMCLIRGNKFEKLDKEKKEAYAATVKYEGAVRALEEVNAQIVRYEEELESLSDVDNTYNVVVNRKIDYVKKYGEKEVEDIKRLESSIVDMESILKEIQEAVNVGRRAKDKAHRTLLLLRSASDYGKLDMMGGGMMSTSIKHSKLDEAGELVEDLQRELREFKIELADVNIDIRADIKVKVEDYMKLADYFVDGLFADISVQKHIKDTILKVEDIDSNINYVLNQLEKKRELIYQEQKNIKDKIDNIVLEK